MTTEVRKYLDEIKTAVAAIAPDAEIILFGSQARGDARPDSDIDLLILVDREKLSWKESLDITLPISNIEIKYRLLINPLVYTRKKWFDRPYRTPFFINVMNEGVQI